MALWSVEHAASSALRHVIERSQTCTRKNGGNGCRNTGEDVLSIQHKYVKLTMPRLYTAFLCACCKLFQKHNFTQFCVLLMNVRNDDMFVCHEFECIKFIYPVRLTLAIVIRENHLAVKSLIVWHSAGHDFILCFSKSKMTRGLSSKALPHRNR